MIVAFDRDQKMYFSSNILEKSFAWRSVEPVLPTKNKPLCVICNIQEWLYGTLETHSD